MRGNLCQNGVFVRPFQDAIVTAPSTLLTLDPPDNIDYNSLKHFIKVHTTKDEAKAIAIPGQPDTHLAKVEDDLYHELCAQHDAAGLFVTAKADEINRRLRTHFSLELHVTL